VLYLVLMRSCANVFAIYIEVGNFVARLRVSSSPEWNDVADSVKAELAVIRQDDGEFWFV